MFKIEARLLNLFRHSLYEPFANGIKGNNFEDRKMYLIRGRCNDVEYVLEIIFT